MSIESMENQSALATKVEEFVDVEELKNKAAFMLKLAKTKGATQCEVDFSSGLGLNVNVRLGEVENLEFNRDKGVSITVYVGGRKGSVSSSDLSTKSLEDAVQVAMDIAKMTEEDPFAGLADPKDLAKEIVDLDLYHPWNLSTARAIELAQECEAIALEYNPKIINSEGASISTSQGLGLYANSNGFCGGYPVSRHSLSCVVIGKDNESMERNYHYTSARSASHLETPVEVGMKAAQNTLARLNGVKVATQTVPVLFSSKIASGLIGHLIGAVSGGRLYRKSTFLLDSLGQPIFPDFVEIEEDPHVLQGLGSSPFDNDGVLTKRRAFVKQGVLQGYILGAYSARKLNMRNTGHSGGVYNMFVRSTQHTVGLNLDFDQALEQQLKLLDRGLYVTEVMGDGVNMVTGDYSRGASGFWVENGQIVHPVHEITISGNLKSMFKGILEVGSDVDKRFVVQTGSLLIDKMMVGGA